MKNLDNKKNFFKKTFVQLGLGALAILGSIGYYNSSRKANDIMASYKNLSDVVSNLRDYPLEGIITSEDNSYPGRVYHLSEDGKDWKIMISYKDAFNVGDKVKVKVKYFLYDDRKPDESEQEIYYLFNDKEHLKSGFLIEDYEILEKAGANVQLEIKEIKRLQKRLDNIVKEYEVEGNDLETKAQSENVPIDNSKNNSTQ